MTLGDRDDPERVVREPVDVVEHGRPLGLGHRASLEHRLGGALHHHPRAVGVVPHRALAPAHGIERVPGDALARVALTGRLGQRAVHRILRGGRAMRGPRGCQHALAVAVDLLDHEPVLGERPGLVGEQHRHRADGFRGAKAPQQDAMLRQAQAAERDERRHEDRQLLGDRGERKGQPVEQHVARGLAAEDAEERHEHARRHRHDKRVARQLGHRALQRGRRLLRLRDEPAEAPDLRVLAEPDDDSLAGAGDDGGPGMQQRGPLGERRARVDGLGPLRGRQGLAGEPGLVGGQPVRRHHTGVGGDDGPRLDEQHIADHEVPDRNRLRDARPPDERVGRAEVAQRPQRALGADFRDRLDGADDHDDDEDGDRVAELPEDRREHRHHDQQQHERLQERLGDLLQDVGGLALRCPLRRSAAALGNLLCREPRRPAGRALPQLGRRFGVDRGGGRIGRGVRRRRCARHETHDMPTMQRNP